MNPFRSVARRRLDERLDRLGERIGPRPGRGWIRAIREAHGMSTSELARRVGVTQSRVSQLERAEVDGSLRLSTLERVAASLHCKVCYALVPDEPLETIVLRQALDKAARVVSESSPDAALIVEDALSEDDPSLLAEAVHEEIEELAHELIDSRGLWSTSPPAVDGRQHRPGQTVWSDR